MRVVAHPPTYKKKQPQTQQQPHTHPFFKQQKNNHLSLQFHRVRSVFEYDKS